MSQSYEIPLTPKPQTFGVTLPSGVAVQMRLNYQFNDDRCWLLDIADTGGNLLVAGIPLVTGADLLAQYAYLGLGVKLFVTTDGYIAEPPHWWNLGGSAHLWAEI